LSQGEAQPCIDSLTELSSLRKPRLTADWLSRRDANGLFPPPKSGDSGITGSLLARGRAGVDNNRCRPGGRIMPPMLVVGTRNPKKREEILEILGDLGVELGDLTSFPGAPEVVEDGETFLDNARKKAERLSRHLGQWVLGEDSGLVVPALNGRP